jgi:hypothetical protein
MHPDADAVARHPRLGDLEERAADAVAVADADLVVLQPLDREVLAELPIAEVVAAELALPIPVGAQLIDEDRAMLAAVRQAVGLVVAVDVDPPHHPRAVHGGLPDRGANRLALPRDLARPADVERDEPHHAGRQDGATATGSAVASIRSE